MAISKKKLVLLIAMVVVVFLVFVVISDNTYTPDYLIIADDDHPVSAEYASALEFATASNYAGTMVNIEKRAFKACYALVKALEKQGIVVNVSDGFLDDPKDDHGTGLGIDLVISKDEKWLDEPDELLAETEAFETIHALLPEYGFIVRYPEGAESVTGHGYEPWHIRYVGKEAAREIADRGITLEEYVR
jgi:D-alanyl-D-alanine carboxypeptidase